jgi:Papain-like cysteine protease AvrRpt2
MANGSATVMQPGFTAAGFFVKSNRLGPYFGASAGEGSGGNPAMGSGGNPAMGSGGNPAMGSGGNPAMGSGGGRCCLCGKPTMGSGGNPAMGSGSNPAMGSGGNPAMGSGGNPAMGSGGGPSCCLCGSFAIALGHACGAERSGPTMPFQVENQEESKWCWAAVSSAVDRYYSPQSFLSQCEVASDVLEPADVCDDPDKYDRPGALAVGLNVIGRDDRVDPVTGKIQFDELQTEIDAGRPVCVCIQWNGSANAAHFVALCGYREWSGLRLVDVADPFYPDSTQDFDIFPLSYHGGGSWLQTYFTK